MATTATVKRALAALAARTDTTSAPYVAVIDEAEAALDDLERAAVFVDGVGLERLETAVASAETAGDTPVAERGTRALDTYLAFQRAASGELDPTNVDVAKEASSPGRRSP